MIVEKKTTFDIKHTGDEMDRCELLSALNMLARMCNNASLCQATVESVKSDIVQLTVVEIDAL